MQKKLSTCHWFGEAASHIYFKGVLLPNTCCYAIGLKSMVAEFATCFSRYYEITQDTTCQSHLSIAVTPCSQFRLDGGWWLMLMHTKTESLG